MSEQLSTVYTYAAMDEIIYKHIRKIAEQYFWAGIAIGLAAGFVAGIYW
jgi:hypothetical protein